MDERGLGHVTALKTTPCRTYSINALTAAEPPTTPHKPREHKSKNQTSTERRRDKEQYRDSPTKAKARRERQMGNQESLHFTQLCTPPPRWQQCRTAVQWEMGTLRERCFSPVLEVRLLGRGPGPPGLEGRGSAGWEKRHKGLLRGKCLHCRD